MPKSATHYPLSTSQQLMNKRTQFQNNPKKRICGCSFLDSGYAILGPLCPLARNSFSDRGWRKKTVLIRG